jgi:hypothetical protein
MLTAGGDHDLLMIDSNRPSEIFELNLDRGEIVAGIECKDPTGVTHSVDRIIHECRDDSSCRTFLGFNCRNTFRIDPREPVPIVAQSDYKGDCKFTAGITSKSGYLAMGSERGVVRLYKGPCLGRATVKYFVNTGDQPVLALDSSPDQQWIVATCPYSIVVFNVLANSTGKLAFVTPMNFDTMRVTVLKPLPVDMQRMSSNNGGVLPPFVHAKFEIKAGKVAAIVASMGDAIFCWDFRAIEKDGMPKYSITFLEMEHVVDTLPLEETADVLYITPNHFAVAPRKHRNMW